MKNRKDIENDMEQFISAHPMPDEIAFYHGLILEVFLDIRELLMKKEKIVIREEISLSNRDYAQKVIIPELIHAIKNGSLKINLKDITGIQ